MKLLAVVLVLVVLAGGCGGPSESPAHKSARRDAKTEAGYYCTMTPAGADANYIYSDEFKNCVKAQTRVFLGEWEAEHPGK